MLRIRKGLRDYKYGDYHFARLVLLGLPLGDSRHVCSKAIRQWTNDEKRILGMANGLGEVKGFGCEQQWGPFQAEAFHSIGSNTGLQYRGTKAPYRLLENALEPLGETYVSGGIEDEDFWLNHQRSLLQEERSRRAGNDRKRPRETEKIQGLGSFDNFGYGERSKRIGDGSSSTDNSSKEMKELHAIDKERLEMLECSELANEIREMLEDIDSDSETSVTSESSLEG